MDIEKKVLLMTEGEVVEDKLFKHLYFLYGENNVQIIPYKTNIYSFYHRLLKDYNIDGEIDFDSIDIPLFLNEYFKFEGNQLLNEQDFSDVILVFDYDPHDPNYESEKVKVLLKNFNESSDKGKLYINYPMVESFQHINSLEDTEFMSRKVKLNDLIKRHKKSSHYKKVVSDISFITEITDIDAETMKKIIEMHHNKLITILQQVEDGSSMNEENFMELCDIQCSEVEKNQEMWVVNTSLLHMLHEYGELD